MYLETTSWWILLAISFVSASDANLKSLNYSEETADRSERELTLNNTDASTTTFDGQVERESDEDESIENYRYDDENVDVVTSSENDHSSNEKDHDISIGNQILQFVAEIKNLLVKERKMLRRIERHEWRIQKKSKRLERKLKQSHLKPKRLGFCAFFRYTSCSMKRKF